MPNKVSKSDNLLQKEAELADIIKEQKKTKRNLKSNKTRLKNDRSMIADLQREMDRTIHSHQKILFDLQSELLVCLENAKRSKKIAEVEKQQFEELHSHVSSEIPTEEEMQQMAEEFARQNAQDNYNRRMFEKFHKKPPIEDQKSIRKLYIALSKRFHPDLAKNKKESVHFGKIMVRVVAAYEASDIAELLEIEKEYVNYNNTTNLDLSDQSSVISYIQQKINKQTNELNLLKGQLVRIRKELKQLKQSEEGELLKEYKRLKKSGHDLLTIMTDDLKSQIDSLKVIIKGVNKYAKTGKMPDDLEMLLTPSYLSDYPIDDLEFFDDDFFFDF